jgi:hypothetical protein
MKFLFSSLVHKFMHVTKRPTAHYNQTHAANTGSGAHPATYPVGTGGKAAGAWTWPLTTL